MNYIICNWNNVAEIVHANEIQSKKKNVFDENEPKINQQLWQSTFSIW